MNCQDSQELIQRMLDGEVLPSSSELADHAHHCAVCRDMHTAALVLRGALAILEPPEPPSYLAPRIVAGVLAERKAQRSWRKRYGARMALAASVMLLLLGVWMAPRSAKPVPAPAVPVVAKKTEPPPTLRRMASETGESVAVDLRKTADEKVKQTGQVLGALVGPIKPDTTVSTPTPPSDPLRGTREGVSSGLEPVSTSAQRAFKLFLKEVPPLEAEPNTGS